MKIPIFHFIPLIVILNLNVANAQLILPRCVLACESGPDADVVAAIRVDRSLAEVAALLLPLEGTSWVSLTNTLRLWG